MLYALATDVGFHVPRKRVSHAPAVLFDESGEFWPADSLLGAGYQKDGRDPRNAEDLNGWFGDEYDFREGSVKIPPKDIHRWNYVGDCARITFTRRGKYKGKYEHPYGSRTSGALRMLFGGRDVLGFRSGNLPKLYQLNRAYRLELGRGCIVGAKGFEYP